MYPCDIKMCYLLLFSFPGVMGAKQSKRSMDITGTPVKGEVEGLGHEGRLEKIVEGVVEKVAANGHVEPELQVLYLNLIPIYLSIYFLMHSFISGGYDCEVYPLHFNEDRRASSQTKGVELLKLIHLNIVDLIHFCLP